MPLRFRLIALVLATLFASLALGSAVTLINASRSVRTEMRSALLVGQQTVDNIVREIDGSPDPQHDLDDLVASFKGSRHLRVSVTGGARAAEAWPVKDRLPFGGVPKWFVEVIGVDPEIDRVPITIGGRPSGGVIIETDPRNEIREVWNELTGSFIVLAVFAGSTIPLIYWVIGRGLRPLQRLADAMEQFGQGDYAIRVSDPLTPELARLRDSFNRMAARLDATDADNRRLHEQLLTLQEEERTDIARDLHDEVGPFLFAINVDIANMTRLLGEGRTEELLLHTQSISDAARHLQRLVRSMLGRLRPIGLAEFGLAEAVGRLVDFWRRRYPEIEYRAGVAPQCEDLGERTDTTIYRIVQECLSNAVRHGKPRLITISVKRDAPGDYIIVDVADDGAGLHDEPALGYGILGMEERVRVMGGRLSFGNQPNGGFAVSAMLPCLQPLSLSALPEAAR
jgi:two-component system sensor histidine kinase UhpB